MASDSLSSRWGQPSLPSLSNSISRVIEDKLQAVDQTMIQPTLVLATQLVRILQARNLPEYTFLEQSGTPIGEGATYSVTEILAFRTDNPDPETGFNGSLVARKIAKFSIPKAFRNVEIDSEEYNRLRVVLFESDFLSHPAIKEQPHIASLMGFSWDETDGGYAPCLIMEVASYGNARSFTTNSTLKEADMFALCGHVSSGLAFLHTCNIVHGDVKQENVLIFSNPQSTPPFTAKITDFERSPQSGDKVRYTGTTTYNAPEVLYGRAQIEHTDLWRCDVFAFGLLVLEVFSSCRNYKQIDPSIQLRGSVGIGSRPGKSKCLTLTKSNAYIRHCLLILTLVTNQTMRLAIILAEKFQHLSPTAVTRCSEVLRLTLPDSPTRRLPNGWEEVLELLGTEM